MTVLRLVPSGAMAGAGVRCDRCPVARTLPTDRTMAELETSLRMAGWLVRDGVHVCPECRAKI